MIRRVFFIAASCSCVGATVLRGGDGIEIDAKVMPRWSSVQIKIKDKVIATAADLQWPMKVGLVQKKYVWLTSPRIEGWAYADHLLTLDQAVTDYSAQLGALLKPGGLEYLHAFRGDCYADRGEFEKAIEDYDEAIRREKKNARFYLARAAVYEHQNQLNLALADCDAAIQVDPQRADAYGMRGRLRLTARQIDGAIADCGEAIRLDPRYTDAVFTRGQAWWAKGNAVGALADYGWAIAQSPRPEFFAARAKAFLAMSNVQGALADADRGLRMAPSDPDLLAVRRTGLMALQARRSQPTVPPPRNSAQLPRIGIMPSAGPMRR